MLVEYRFFYGEMLRVFIVCFSQRFGVSPSGPGFSSVSLFAHPFGTGFASTSNP
ncbi:hypothetical protein MASR1M60_19680 [Rhodocyclaceae bacterium]